MNVIKYFKGDKVKINIVKTIEYAGGLWYEGVYLEGHKKGEKMVVPTHTINTK